jgi:L-alanine-DL-glutamate epimerase-like enolase superfamily enzyme
MVTSIHAVDIIPLMVPLKNPIRARERTLTNFFCCLCTVTMSDGYIGQGLTYHIDPTLAPSILATVKNQWVPLILKKDILSPQDIQKTLVNHFPSEANKYYRYLLSAIDIACWDAWSQAQNTPLSKLFNVTATRVKIYGSGGWLSYSDAELIKECQDYAEKGVFIYKFKVSSVRDKERVALLRREMGESYTLLADANQAYTLTEAIATTNWLADYNIYWLEEPIMNDETVSLKTLSQSTSMAIATGENRLTYAAFADLCDNNAAVILQPDIVRCGGISSFIQIGELTDLHQLKLSTHLNHELSISLLPAFQSGSLAEHMDLFPEDCFTQSFMIREGQIKIPEVPGTGVTLSDAAIKKYRM